MDAPSGHREVGVSSVISPPSNRVTVAVLVDCPHEPQFLPDMIVTQSASVAAGRATRQARPFTQKGEVQENMALEVAAKRLLPRNHGDNYIVLQSWISSRLGRPFARSTSGDARTLPCLKGTSHHMNVPGPSIMTRHLKLFQGIPS